MNISLKKTKALYIKDLLDFFKNPSIFVLTLLPIGFTLLYTNILPDEMPKHMLLIMGVVMNITMLSAMISSTSIAEEKEKNTLRTLILSNVSASEFFLSKILVTCTFTLITNVIIYIITGSDIKYVLGFILITTIGGISVVVIGALTGILSRDQMSSGIYQMPILLIIMLPPIIAPINDIIGTIAKFTPCDAILKLVIALIDGKLLTTDSLLPFAVIIAWIIISFIGFNYVYKKSTFDN